MTGIITSLSADGTLAPGAGASVAIATLSHTKTTQAGVYRVRCSVAISGTVGAADNDNIQFVIGSTSQKLAVPGADGGYGPFSFMVMLDGSTDVVLSTASAGPTVGTYYGLIVADYCGSNGQLAKFLPS